MARFIVAYRTKYLSELLAEAIILDMNKTTILWLALLSTSILAFAAQEQSVARFEGETTLLRPEGYREWIFVGSSLGLAYSQDPEVTRGANIYKNVYINPSSYREFARTGKFPEGTMMILELFSSDVKREPGLQGSFEKDFISLEMSVKDSVRFEGGWGYFNFSEGGVLKAKADANPPNLCFSCHDQNAATDHVFTQFYPVLRDVAPKSN